MGPVTTRCKSREGIAYSLRLPFLQGYANSLGVKVVGDMPIYVGGHSADVWANRLASPCFHISFPEF